MLKNKSSIIFILVFSFMFLCPTKTYASDPTVEININEEIALTADNTFNKSLAPQTFQINLDEEIALTADNTFNKSLAPQAFQINLDEEIALTADNTLNKSTSGKTIKIMVEEKITTETNKQSKENSKPEVKETPVPKTKVAKPTATPKYRLTMPQRSQIKATPTPNTRIAVPQRSQIKKSLDTKTEVRPTPTPTRRSRWSSFFSRSSGRAIGMDASPEEAPSTSGSCNSPGNDGLALLSMILLPIIFRSKSIFKPKKN